jgi:anti-sigma regulatory factor (Ser/Thr protein kinase)
VAPADIEMKAQAVPRILCAVRGLVRGYFTNVGFSEEQAGELTLAVDEACANTVRHSYRGRSPGELRLRLEQDEESGAVTVTIEDDGETAPPGALETGLPEAPSAEDVRPGGLGVPLMRRVCEEVRFGPCGEGGNRVVLRVRPAAEQTETGEARG